MNLDLRPNNGIDRRRMDCVWSFSLCPDSNEKKKKMKSEKKKQNKKPATEQKQLVQISPIKEQEWARYNEPPKLVGMEYYIFSHKDGGRLPDSSTFIVLVSWPATSN